MQDLGALATQGFFQLAPENRSDQDHYSDWTLEL